MAQELRELDPSLSARDRFGAALRQWRLRRGLSHVLVGASLHLSGSQIAKVEKAQRWLASQRHAEALDNLLGAGGDLVELWALADAERSLAVLPPRPLTDLSYVAHWANMLGVLAATGNAVGGRGLFDVVSCEISLMERFGAAASGQSAADYLSLQARWLEFGSWIADNQGNIPLATLWLRKASVTAERAHDSLLSSYILMRRAQRAFEQFEPSISLSLLSEVSAAGLPPRIAALIATRQAQAHAALGNRDEARGRLKLARVRLAEDIASDPADLAIAAHATPDYVQAHQGLCLLALNEPQDAALVLDEVLQGWPPVHRLDEGLLRAHLSLAHTAAGDLDQAVVQAGLALTLGVDTGSQRTIRIVRQVLSHNLRGAQGYRELSDRWQTIVSPGGS